MGNIEKEVNNLKSLFSDQKQKDQQIAEENRIESENNKAIFDKSGLPQILQTIVNEKIIDGKLKVEWGEHNLNIKLQNYNQKEGEYQILFMADLSRNDEIVINNSNNNEREKICGIILPSEGIANFIFNTINRTGRKIEYTFNKKTINTPREKEKERIKEEQRLKDFETFKNSFAYKYIKDLVDSKTLKTPIIETIIEKKFFPNLEKKITVGYTYASMGFSLDKESPHLTLFYNHNTQDSYYHYLTIDYCNQKYLLKYITKKTSFENLEWNKKKFDEFELNKNNIATLINQAIRDNIQNEPKESSDYDD